MSLLTVLAIVGVGLIVGVLSGLVGIGGGVLIVPFLYFFYDHPELFGVTAAVDARTVLAHGTSLLVILPTSVRGAVAYHRSGLVEWRAVWPIGLVSVVAALLGAQAALALPPAALKVGFGALLVVSGVRLVAGGRGQSAGQPAAEPRLSLPITLTIGIAVGVFSALLGVGGGTVAIPLLMYLVRLDVRKLAATSIGIIMLTAAAGSAAYMWSGLGEPGLPPGSVGYVHVPAAVAMVVGSVASVRWGARLNQRLRPRTLSLIFAALFVLLGLRLVVGNAVELAALARAALSPAPAAG